MENRQVPQLWWGRQRWGLRNKREGFITSTPPSSLTHLSSSFCLMRQKHYIQTNILMLWVGPHHSRPVPCGTVVWLLMKMLQELTNLQVTSVNKTIFLKLQTTNKWRLLWSTIASSENRFYFKYEETWVESWDIYPDPNWRSSSSLIKIKNFKPKVIHGHRQCCQG